MTLRAKMFLMNQFDHLVNELEDAEEELNTAISYSKTEDETKKLKNIITNTLIAIQRIQDFKTKTIKDLDNQHKARIKRLKTKQDETKA